MLGEVPHGDPLVEHGPILHIASQRQLEPAVFRDEISQARKLALSRDIEQLSEAGYVFVW